MAGVRATTPTNSSRTAGDAGAGTEGVRPREDLDEALAHELADCLWCVMTLADAYDVDLGAAFASTVDSLDESLRSP